MFYFRGIVPFKFGIPCFAVKKCKIFVIEAIVRFWTIDKRKCVTRLSKGVPISIAILNFSMKFDGSPTTSEMNLINSMTI